MMNQTKTMEILAVFAALFVCAFSGRSQVSNCPKNLTNMQVGSSCTLEWTDLQSVLRPTQHAIGFAWAKAKFQGKFQDIDSAKKEMDSSPIPVALDGRGIPYCLDHHHTLAALDFAGVGLSSVKVTIFISCSIEGLSEDEFWSYLSLMNKAYLYSIPENDITALPQKVSYTQLPSKISFNFSGSSFSNDPWRSFSSFVRKIKSGEKCSKGNKYCNRGYDRVCDSQHRAIPFFEFRWAFFMIDASYHNSSLWNNDDDRETFCNAFQNLTVPESINMIDPQMWQDAASLLLPLLRGLSVAKYEIPESIMALAGALPGYHVGKSPITEPDPDCDSPQCSHS